MRRKERVVNWLRTLAGGACVVALLFSASAQAQADSATTVWEAEGSNMGICSSFLGGMQVRDDVNLLLKQYGDLLGIGSPGELYRVRAQQPESKAPAEECLQRQLPR
jgi:hypothetical protein